MGVGIGVLLLIGLLFVMLLMEFFFSQDSDIVVVQVEMVFGIMLVQSEVVGDWVVCLLQICFEIENVYEWIFEGNVWVMVMLKEDCVIISKQYEVVLIFKFQVIFDVWVVFQELQNV